jgi:protein-tyrosine phosphatase
MPLPDIMTARLSQNGHDYSLTWSFIHRQWQSREIQHVCNATSPCPPPAMSGGVPYDRPMRIFYVCTGNVCRSPTAERLTSAYAAEAGRTDLTAHSGGTRAMVGHGMEPTAALVLQQLGGDPDGFIAQRITPQLAEDSDMVITMSERQRNKVVEVAPRMMRVTFTLREAARLMEASGATTVAELAAARTQHTAESGPEDITDPIGQDEETFVVVGSEIADLLLPLLARIRV